MNCRKDALRNRLFGCLNSAPSELVRPVPFRVLIADDHAAVRGLLRVLLENHQDWQVCGEAENAFEAVAKASQLKPDLIILDLAMPVMDGTSRRS